MRTVLLGLAVVAATPAMAASPTITGRWCGDGGTTVIGAMSLRNDDASCTFKSVVRKGSKVTWKGLCSDAEGEDAQTVTATVKGGKLTYRFAPGGNWVGPLTRCK